MNANRARPLLAFGLLALIAALITGLGLGEEISPVEVRAGAPAPVVGAGSSELLLGGQLQAQPTGTGPSPTGLVTGAPAIDVAPGSDAGATSVGRSQTPASTSDPKTAISDHAAPVARTRATVATPGPGKSTQAHGQGSKSTITSTARTTTDTTVKVTGQQAPAKAHGKPVK